MDNQTFLNELQRTLIPSEYTSCLNNKVPEGHVLFKKRLYVFLGMPFDSVPKDDFNSDHARKVLKRAVLCVPMIVSRGLFLLYYGKRNRWENIYEKYEVDTTGFHSVIIQSIHFVDPEDGYNVNTRTHWGAVKFGFCSGVIDRISMICDKVQTAED
jgi:hypothetical protein